MNKKQRLLLLIALCCFIIASVGVLALYASPQEITVATPECVNTCSHYTNDLTDYVGGEVVSDKNVYMQGGRCKCEYLIKTS